MPQLQLVHIGAGPFANSAMSCPVAPCPYCILGLDHSCDFEDIIDTWDVIYDNYQNVGGCEYAFAIQRIAYLWLARAEEDKLPPASLTDVTQNPDRPECWAPTPTQGHAPSRVDKRPKVRRSAPDYSSTSVPAQSSAASGSSSHLPPPPPPPDVTAAEWLNEWWGQQEEQWPQFDWHTEKKSGKKWVPFQLEHQRVLRGALERGQMNVTLDVDGWQYDVDLTPGRESQVARHSEFHRRVRIRYEPES